MMARVKSDGAKPRVLFVCSSLIVGGAERQLSILIPRLGTRFETRVLTLVDEGPFFNELQAAGIPATCVRMRRRTDVAGWRSALRHASFHPHLVVTQSIDADVIGNVIAWRSRARHVTTEHAGPGAPSRPHQEVLRRLVARRVDATIAVSAAQIPRLVRLGYRPETMRVIPNGVPVPRPRRARDTVRARLGIDDESFVAILVATLRPEKRGELFVAALREANAQDGRIRGIIAGGGSELARIRNLAGSDGVVKVLGQRQDVPDLLAAADVACLTSRAEGVPIGLLEAMALAKPIVATDVGGVSEVVQPGSNGVLVRTSNPADFAAALLDLARDRALAHRLGERGRRRHRELFDVDRMIDEYARTFDELLA
jgi:glycosyltransferase involved in cell wall biosynthesis